MSQNSHQVLKLQSDESATNIACKSFVKSSVFTPQWSPSQVQVYKFRYVERCIYL